MIRLGLITCWSLILFTGSATTAVASESSDPESAIRQLVRANAEKDLPTLSSLMAHNADIISYGVAGRKYIGWPELEQGIRDEFANAQKLDIPIRTLTVWTKGDLAWYAMELDYIRYVTDGTALTRTVLPMRETGVLERRDGRWQLLSWHESFRSAQLGGPLAQPPAAVSHRPTNGVETSTPPNVRGE
ncbi:MAG: nuclear transport factor 2 family protein [Nitrospira sp.]|nr:nuclear transport factor 2 family protein [Nitrospira sp.]